MSQYDYDEDEQEALGQPYDGSPQQQELMERSLRQRYEDAANSDEVDKERARARRGEIIGAAFQGLGDYVAARGVARGGAPMRDIQSGIRQAGTQRVADAAAARREKMADVLEGDRLSQMEKDRTRQTTDQAFQDKERAHKEAGMKIEDAYNDPASTQSKAIRDQYASMFPSLAKTPGFENLSANDIKAGLADPLKLKESIEARKEEAAQRSADRQAMLGAAAGRRADEKAEKEEHYQEGAKVDGLEIKPGFRPTADATKKVRDAKTSHDSLTSSLDALTAVYDKTGTNMVGDDSNTQASLVENMKMELKNLQALGALSGSDYAALERQVPDPTSATENLKGMVGADSFKAKASAFRQALDSKLNATAENAGYHVPKADKAQMSPDDQAALDWAKANKTDPRAVQIVTKLHNEGKL